MDLERELVIDASPETIWELLTDAEQHTRWEGTDVEIDARPGGVYRVKVAGVYQSHGEFVELVPYERLVYTFGWDMPDNPITPGSTTVTVTLTPEGEKTRLSLLHSGLPDQAAVTDHEHGWGLYLGRLAVVAAGGEVEPDGPDLH